ncbi:MAG TPA: SprT family zinc-dependent metalloprotease [Ruminococcus sp.]
MKAVLTETRKVQTVCGEIVYTFELKKVKNINLRIKHNGYIYVSAPRNIPKEIVDTFVISKCNYIQNALDHFNRNDVQKSEMQYASGENVTFLGKNMRINVVKDSQEYVSCDGVYVYLHVKRPDYYNHKKNLLNAWLNEQCETTFTEIMKEVHKKFIPYNVEFPQLKLRNMTSRWGSCHPYKAVITLNKCLIEAPRNCIEYVVCHEFCHFIHPNHSKQFYSLLQIMLPDWRERKELLEKIEII